MKDNFNIIGKDSTVGYASLVQKPATQNATLVDILAKAGAVRYVKTNVPTAMMIAESVNNVFGRTVNPLNRKLTSGGSSGGESALVAFGGSPLGVGTDIVPSMYRLFSVLLMLTGRKFAYTSSMHGHIYTPTFFWTIPYSGLHCKCSRSITRSFWRTGSKSLLDLKRTDPNPEPL